MTPDRDYDRRLRTIRALAGERPFQPGDRVHITDHGHRPLIGRAGTVGHQELNPNVHGYPIVVDDHELLPGVFGWSGVAFCADDQITHLPPEENPDA